MDEEKEQNLEQENKPVSPPPGLRKLLHKGKKQGKNAAKKLANGIKKAIHAIWMAMPFFVKIIVIVVIIFIIICACAIIVLAEHPVNESTQNVSTYVLDKFGSLKETNVEEAKFYADTGSMLLMKDVDIKGMAQSFIEYTDKKYYDLNTLMKQEYGSSSEEGYVDINEKKILYEHFLNAEKYNFNNIKWVKYDRSVESGTPTMKLDAETKLHYPEDSKDTTLKTFANMTQPYLQNYIIPYSLYSGLITDNRIRAVDVDESGSKLLRYGYELLKNTYHEIQINQYNLKSYTKITSQNVYDVFKVTVKQSVTYKDGALSSKSDPVYTYNNTPAQSCVQDSVVLLDEITEWNVKYGLKHAKLFDKQIIDEYQFIEYNLNNEPDDQSLSRSTYKDENYYKYENKTYLVSDDSFELKYDDDGNVIDGTYTATETFNVKEGYTDTVTSTWKDMLVQLSHEEKTYTVEDVNSSLSTGELSSGERKYYKGYEYVAEKDNMMHRLNLFDIANSKQEVYKNYLRAGENYSLNIGYARSWMTFAYRTLKQAIQKIQEEKSGWKYFYGSSVGAKEATYDGTSSSKSTNLTGIDYSSLPEGKLGWPSPGHSTISSRFGPRGDGNHNGIDISMPIGSTFVAAASGKVVDANSSCTDNYGKPWEEIEARTKTYCGGNLGNYVKIKVDGSDVELIYMHMTDVTVNVGDEVKAGQAIGTCGTTGRSTGPHAHFEVRVAGKAVDPCTLFADDYCGDASKVPDMPLTSGDYSGMEASTFKAIANMASASYDSKKSKIESMSDLEALSRVIHGEQGNNSFGSQVFVGISVLNRVKLSGYPGPNTIQGKISAKNSSGKVEYSAIDIEKFWGDIPQEAVNAAKTAIAAMEKGEYYIDAYRTASSTSTERINAISVEAFQAMDNKSSFSSTWSGWSAMKLRGIVENTAGAKYTGFYWRD